MTTILLYTVPLIYDRKQARIDRAIDRVKNMLVHRFHRNYTKVVEKTEPYIDKIIPAQNDQDSYSTSVSGKDSSSTSQRNKDSFSTSQRNKESFPTSQSGKDSHSTSQYSQGSYPTSQNEATSTLKSGKHELPTEKDFNNRHGNISKPEVKTYDPRQMDIDAELEAHQREVEQKLREGDYNLVGSREIPDPITVPAPIQRDAIPTEDKSFPISKNNETLQQKSTHGLKQKLQHA